MGWRNPEELSEFEVQAVAYLALKAVYRNVRGEYHFKLDGKRAARFDIAILSDSGELLLVIEVKGRGTEKALAQGFRYGDLTGKPVMYLRGAAECANAVNLVEGFLVREQLGHNYLPRKETHAAA